MAGASEQVIVRAANYLPAAWFVAVHLHPARGADACLPAAAKSGGMNRVLAPRGSMERNDPGSWSVRASGSPKFEALPNRMRAGSRTLPGYVKAAVPPRFHQIYIRDNKKESSFTPYFQP